MYEFYNKMDNLGIVKDRIVENSRPNPNKYGLVKSVGPFDPTPADIYNVGSNLISRIIPRRNQVIEPDAVPNGVNDDLMWLPTLIGGGFSMENGSVVQEAIYDARITAPGQKVRGIPMEGPGVLSAIESVVNNLRPTPAAPTSTAEVAKPATTPYTMPDSTKQVPPLTEEEIKKIKDDIEKIRSTQHTGFGTHYDISKLKAIYDKMDATDRVNMQKALEEWQKMDVNQRYREWIKESSILRRIYTLYKGEMPAKYVAQFLDVAKELIEMSAWFG